MRRSANDFPADIGGWQLLGGFVDDRGQIGEAAVLQADVDVTDLQVQAAVLTAIDAAVVGLCQHLVAIVASVIVHRGLAAQA